MDALAKKLLIRSGTCWLFYDAPATCMQVLQHISADTQVVTQPQVRLNGILIFTQKQAELADQLKKLITYIHDDTIVWAVYPKKRSGIETDLFMGQWDMLVPFGLTGVASVAFDDNRTCMRLRREGLSKKTGVAIAEIRKSDYGNYIDVGNRVITLPPDVDAALMAQPDAMASYEKLAWSHRKEYIIWILTAKQQTTRQTRLVKMVDMLLAGKKNPADK